MRRRPTLVGLIVLLLAACGDAAAESEIPDPGATHEIAATTDDPAIAGTAEAAGALQFNAPLVGGGELDFRQFAGTTVALWFWAPT